MPKDGYITASQVSALMVNGSVRKPFGRGAVTYARELARVIVGIQKKELDTPDIQRGNELEEEALQAFERKMFVELERPNFKPHPVIEHFGGTADGLAWEFGVDTKCPNAKNHHDNLIECAQLKKYQGQFQAYMELYDRDRWALASYNPKFPPESRLVVCWMKRDQEYIDKMKERVELFWPIVEEEVEQLENYIITEY